MNAPRRSNGPFIALPARPAEPTPPQPELKERVRMARDHEVNKQLEAVAKATAKWPTVCTCGKDLAYSDKSYPGVYQGRRYKNADGVILCCNCSGKV